jgi:sugar phosphate isomerase/epimerase
METRRAAVHKLAAGVAAGALGGQRWGTLLVPSVGVQLYTLRAEMQKSVGATLARLAQIGYREVEFAGYFNHPPKDVAALLKQHGLSAPAAHVPIEVMRTKWDQTLDDAATVGHRYLIVPYLGDSERTADGYRRVAEEFNRAAERARARGLRFGYHNHDFEFAPLGSTTGFDLLLRHTTPSLVEFELDLFWIAKGAGRGRALEYFAAHPGRFPCVHVKDMTSQGTMVDVGAGTLDFRALFAQASKAGIKHFFVEHDNPSDPFASVTASYRALAAIPVK